MKRPRSALSCGRPLSTRETLAVDSAAPEVVRAVQNHDVVIIIAETGSGKTTRLPQLLVDRADARRVVVTQPRRVAAVSVATRVADERAVDLGDEVGYAVRFDDRSSRTHTRIRYVTDGVLLREALAPDSFRAYSHVVVDEVHERSVNTDIVLGVILRVLLESNADEKVPEALVEGAGKKSSRMGVDLYRHRNQPERHPLKAVVMSATTDAEKLRSFFEYQGKLRVCVLNIPGRAYPVDVFYTAAPVQDFVDAAVTAALQIHVDYPMDGDVLAFLPGQEEILAAISLLGERVRRHLAVEARSAVVALPLFASLPPAEQLRAIEPLPRELRAKRRKIIFSTNVAETSVTIPGVKYVVDSGMAKVRTMIATSGMNADVLRLESISCAQAEQRRGRAGRTCAGIVFRLYTESQFEEMPEYPIPEILRVDAAGTTLQIIAYNEISGGPGLMKFPRLDSPPKKVLAHALETLVALGAVDESMALTDTGALMAKMPVSPTLARSLLEASRLGCVEEVVAVVAMLSVEGSIFFSAPAERDSARVAHRRFLSKTGDHLTLLNVYRAFVEEKGHAKRSSFCRDHYLNLRTLSSAESIAMQLARMIGARDVVDWVSRNPPTASMELEDCDSGDLVRRCVVAGFFQNSARRRHEDGKYVLLSSSHGTSSLAETGVDIHPASVMCTGSAKRGPPLIIFNELVLTSKPYLRTVTAIDHEWLLVHSGQYYEAVEGL